LLALTPQLKIEIDKELSSRSLAEFVKRAWHVLEPGQELKWNWHADAICQHLEAITYEQINRLLINIPPGTMKSSLVSVFWPAWEWGPKGMDYLRIIGASHEAGLATRDSRKMRNLVTSEWYQQRWPITLTGDQNQKTYYETTTTGFRQSCAVKSMTGKRGDRVIWDDPHSVEAALSQLIRETAIRVFKETLPTRVNNPDKSAIIIVMQRLHEDDVSGHILSEKLDYEHLCLPMEYEKGRRCKTSIGFKDPRKKKGELLFPQRFPREVVERDKKTMGKYAVAGQNQQRPAPRSGGFFEWEKLKTIEELPKNITKWVRYWDKAGTEDGGAFTAGVLMGITSENDFIVADVVRGQWAASKREKSIKATAHVDGKKVKIWIEQEPGSGGKESAESTIKRLRGFTCKAERATGDKAVRAEPYSVQVEAGNVYVLNRDWTKEFIDEHKTFPVGKYKDQIDGASGAFNRLNGKSAAPRARTL
jgi:predicted phage terminase large subunit-like protein